MQKTIIKMPRGNGIKLAKALRCSTVIVSLSLNGKKRTALARKIRHVALTQYDGQEFIAKKQEINH